MANLWNDLVYAARLLRKSPGFTIMAVLVLAIGIGATSAMFSLLDAVLLRPLPFHHPNELMVLWEHPPDYARNSVAPMNFLDWCEQNQVFSSMAAVAGGARTLSQPGASPERIPGQAVTTALFDVLSVKPLAGRTFTAEDGREDVHVVISSERLWRSKFGADPKLIGSSLALDGLPYTVIGVVPAGNQVFYQADLWTPFIPKRDPAQRRMHYLLVIGRLKPGVDLNQARAAMAPIAENIARTSPETNKGWTINIEPLRDVTVGHDLRLSSLVLAAAVGLVLLLACANIAGLLVARGVCRAQEIALRITLGATRSRVVSQLLTESILLAILGGVMGVVLASWLVRIAPSFLPPHTLPAGWALVLDARVIGFAVAVTLATGMLFGFAPAWHATRIPLAQCLQAATRTLTGASAKFRTGLAVGQVAIAVTLVVGAGLLLRTLGSLDRVDPGYHADKVLTMSLVLPRQRYPSPETWLRFYQDIEREIAALPGVQSVGFTWDLPLDGWNIGQPFDIVGGPPRKQAELPAAHYQIVNTKYFDTLGIPILRGRAFTDQDNPSSTPVCIVNEELVRRYLSGKEPIGTRLSVEALKLGGHTPEVREIVGVVRQVKVEGRGERENAVEVYVPITQNPWFSTSLAIATATDPMSLASPVKAAIARIDKDEAVTRVRTMNQVAAESVDQPRFRAQLAGAFATQALILSAVGIFGLLAFSVSLRNREFGIRMALGAQPGQILSMVLASGFRIVLAGIAMGLAAALALTRSLASLLYGISLVDPLTFISTPLILSAVALLACAVPALRASRVHPAVALRQE